MSLVVVFKYKAAPVSPGESSALEEGGGNGSDPDDDQGNIITINYIIILYINIYV